MSNFMQRKKEQKELQKKNDSVDLTKFDGLQTGFEETYDETFKTPFLKILQDLSPECKKSSSDYLEDSESGMFCNSATKQLYIDLNIIVLKIVHNLVVWKPNRGGFVAVYPKSKEPEIVKEVNGLEKYDKSGNEVVDTISFFCVNADDPSDLFILPLSKASFKHASKFATRIRMLKIDGKNVNVAFAGVWNIKTVEESNDKGSWFTIGGTPTFQRCITENEFENVIKPSLELFTKAEIDYSQMESKTQPSSLENNEDVQY